MCKFLLNCAKELSSSTCTPCAVCAPLDVLHVRTFEVCSLDGKHRVMNAVTYGPRDGPSGVIDAPIDPAMDPVMHNLQFNEPLLQTMCNLHAVACSSSVVQAGPASQS